MNGINEGAVERAMLEWLASLGRSVAHGPDISPPDARTPGTERDSYREVAVRHRLHDAIARLISGKLRLPEAQEQREDALA